METFTFKIERKISTTTYKVGNIYVPVVTKVYTTVRDAKSVFVCTVIADVNSISYDVRKDVANRLNLGLYTFDVKNIW